MPFVDTCRYLFKPLTKYRLPEVFHPFKIKNEGKEIGRIIESPVSTLEEDIRDILFDNPSIPTMLIG